MTSLTTKEYPSVTFTAAEYQALLRCDLTAFAHRAFLDLHPDQEFASNWHIELALAELELCRTGKTHRLIVTQPPRTLKSILVSVILPAWIMGHDPTRSVICITYAQPLADKHARDFRSLVTSPWYQQLFPAMRLSDARQAVAELTTTMNGSRLATSVAGTITGFGGDTVIIDDPIKPDDAQSDVVRRKINDSLTRTVFSRSNDMRTGCVIIAMQRLHEDDFVGHVLRRAPLEWKVLSLPAIAETPQTYTWETPLGQFQHHRAEGDVLHPARMSFELLQKCRIEIGEAAFACQYQQNPQPQGGGMVNPEWFKRYRDGELPKSFDVVAQSWDCANTASELSSFSCCITIGVKNGRFYLLNNWRKHVNYPDLKRAVQARHDHYRPNVILIEDGASGTQLIQEFQAAGMSNVQPYRSAADKTMRLHAQTGVIENGLVFLPEQAHWVDEYLQELQAFPHSRFSDQVDATSQALDWLRNRPPGWAFETYMMRTYGAAAAAEVSDEIEIIAPQYPGTIYTRLGRQITPNSYEKFKITKAERPLQLWKGYKYAKGN